MRTYQYFISHKLLLVRSCSTTQMMHFIVYICICCSCTPHMYCGVKNQVETCDLDHSCVICVFTGNCVLAKIACNSACACQILSFTYCKCAGTCMCPHMYVKFKLSCTAPFCEEDKWQLHNLVYCVYTGFSLQGTNIIEHINGEVE